ncbi:MAG: radical SAM protein [Thermoplasmatota archaeon]
MNRPRARQISSRHHTDRRYLILDGYVDEPASLGVPPYLSPMVRSVAGGLVSGGADHDDIGYITVDQWRYLRGEGKSLSDPKMEAVFCVMGCLVPGKYLRGTPISRREVIELESEIGDAILILVGGGGSAVESDHVDAPKGDPGVIAESFSRTGRIEGRDRNRSEWNQHLIRGAFIAGLHPDNPSPLICEIEIARGCVRYISAGCSFCIEPGKGPIQFREPADIIEEVSYLAEAGVLNIRIGGQSDLISYMSPEAGLSETPVPDPDAIGDLFRGVRDALHGGPEMKKAISRGLRLDIDCGIIHTDNANPSVIAAHPEESARIIGHIARYGSPGSVLALGLESTDPEVREINNLNSGPDEAMTAVEIINGIGRDRGINGMPKILPGINFLGALPGQTERSFAGDTAFLCDIYDRGLMVRRINIRAALYPDSGGRPRPKWENASIRRAFRKFKEEVRNDLDVLFLRRMLPEYSVLKGVFMEASLGNVHFGRQVGSYPILVGIGNSVDMGVFIDAAVTSVSSRSVGGFSVPFPVNRVPYRDLTSLPGVGKKRAAAIFRGRPVSHDDLRAILEDGHPVLHHIDYSE